MKGLKGIGILALLPAVLLAGRTTMTATMKHSVMSPARASKHIPARVRPQRRSSARSAKGNWENL